MSIKIKNTTQQPFKGNGLVQLIRGENSIRYKWVKIHNQINHCSSGSVIHSRLLFLLCINEIVTDIVSNIRRFADDTSLFIIVENPDTAAELLKNLKKYMTWAKTWRVSFNPKKNRVSSYLS